MSLVYGNVTFLNDFQKIFRLLTKKQARKKLNLQYNKNTQHLQ